MIRIVERMGPCAAIPNRTHHRIAPTTNRGRHEELDCGRPAPTHQPPFASVQTRDADLVDKFLAPFEFTVTGKWTKYASKETFLWNTRVGVVKSEFLVTTSGAIAGTTPQEAVDGFCATAAKGGNTSTNTESTIFGVAAVQRDFVAATDCSSPGHVGFGENSWFVPSGNTIRIISAQVGPNVISVIADAPTDQWPTLSPRSMTWWRR